MRVFSHRLSVYRLTAGCMCMFVLYLQNFGLYTSYGAPNVTKSVTVLVINISVNIYIIARDRYITVLNI